MGVLVVDDEASFRLIMEKRLAASGHRVECVESGETALASLSAHAVDVVLLDLRMPGLGGLETLRQIRNAGLACEVVVLTGQPDYDDCVDAMKLGAFHYLRKPTEPALIEDTLRRAADHFRLRRENAALRRMLGLDRQISRRRAERGARVVEPDGLPASRGIRSDGPMDWRGLTERIGQEEPRW